MLAQVQELANQGMAQVVLAGAGFGIGPGYGLLWSSKMSLPYLQ